MPPIKHNPIQPLFFGGLKKLFGTIEWGCLISCSEFHDKLSIMIIIQKLCIHPMGPIK